MNRAVVVSSLVLVLPGPAAHGQESTKPSRACTDCTQSSGWLLRTETGAGYVFDDSFKFGDYTGLHEEGGFFFGDIFAEYWGNSNNQWRLEGRNLGLDSRSIAFDGGRPGRYDFRFSYAQLPHFLFESSSTPFVNPSSSSLTLPDNWLSGFNTNAMPLLNPSLRPVEVRTERDTFTLGFSFVQSERLEYDLDYRYSAREGTGTLGGSFLNTSTILPRPIDYATQTLEAGISYQADSWSMNVGYFGSVFSNDTPALSWDNPFIPATLGADTGEIALEPDNEFHQFTLSGQFSPAPRTQLSGGLALGKMTQDDGLLAFTTNKNLFSPLPTQSLDAAVDTLHFDLRVASRPIQKLRLRASYTFDERDNQTPSLLWSYVTTDALPAATRVNVPYSYEREKVNLSADYRLHRNIKASGGWKRNVTRRDFTEVGRSEDDELWGKVKIGIGSRVDLSAEYGYANRTSSDYRLLPDTQPPQNPLLRKFDLADRKTRGVEFNVALRTTDVLDLSLIAEFREDDYEDSALGLIDAEYESVYADASVGLYGDATLSTHAGYEKYESRQLGSQSFAQPDWHADNEDETVSAGLLVDFPTLLDRIDMQLGYTFSETTGEVSTRTSGVSDAFPDLETTLRKLELVVDYRRTENLTFRGRWIFENYGVDDWPSDGVEVDTLPRVLSLGNRWLDHNVNVAMLTFKYSLCDAK